MCTKNNLRFKTTVNKDNKISAVSVDIVDRNFIGERKSLRRGNSASYIFKRGIYMLKDKGRGSARDSKHPYIVFQADDDFINTVGITTISITKTPEVIDMIPIINRGVSLLHQSS